MKENIGYYIDLVQMKKNVARECRFEDIRFDFSVDSIKKILEDAVEIEDDDENTTASHRERGVVQKKNGGGIYISPHNIHISTGLILEGIAAVWDMKSDPNPVAVVIFLYNLLKQMCIDMDRWKMTIYMILYEECSYTRITDENILYVIRSKLAGYGYEDIDDDQIMDTVSCLYHMKLILIDGDTYKAAEKIHG